MPGADLSHWLHRLTADEWFAAAAVELGHCEEALLRRAFRPGVTHARRGAGMALNGILAVSPSDAEARWGRSYMDHVRLLADDPEAPAEVRMAAVHLRDTPPAPPELVSLGRPDLAVLDSARRLVTWAQAQVTAQRTAPS